MHPICRVIHAPSALFLFLPSMAPLDEYQRRGRTNPPCLFCGEPNGDCMQHMACYCRSPIALATLRAISSEYRPAQRALMALPLTLSPERIAPVNALASRLRYHRYRVFHVGEHQRNLVGARSRRQRRLAIGW